MKLGSINAVEAYAQGLRDGTLSHVINEIPYLNLLLGYYPDAFVMTDRETSTNGFGFVRTSPQKFYYLHIGLLITFINLCLNVFRCSRKVQVWLQMFHEKSRS